MDWEMPWYTIRDTFDTDFGVNEWHGTNAFIRDGDKMFRTYFINSRGDEQMGSTWNYLDITALGRQEEWEDSPEGYPQTPPYKWWNWHDNYDAEGSPDPKWVDTKPTLKKPPEGATQRRKRAKAGRPLRVEAMDTAPSVSKHLDRLLPLIPQHRIMPRDSPLETEHSIMTDATAR